MQGYQTEKQSITVNSLRNFKQHCRKQVSNVWLLPRLRGSVESLGALLFMQSPTTTYMFFSAIYFPIL